MTRLILQTIVVIKHLLVCWGSSVSHKYLFIMSLVGHIILLHVVVRFDHMAPHKYLLSQHSLNINYYNISIGRFISCGSVVMCKQRQLGITPRVSRGSWA